MLDASCRREDLVAAFEDLIARLGERRTALWDAYLQATREMSPREYDLHEVECWSVLHAGIAGIDAEERVLQREYERRLSTLEGPGVAA